MFENWLGISSDKLAEAAVQTFYMLGWALFFGVLIGVPVGLILVLCRQGGVCSCPAVYFVVNGIVNTVRSVPFVILLVFIAPLTKIITGTRIGTTAAIVPLVFYIAPYLSRLIESSLLEVKAGVLEAAEAMGADHQILSASGGESVTCTGGHNRNDRTSRRDCHGRNHRRRRSGRSGADLRLCKV